MFLFIHIQKMNTVPIVFGPVTLVDTVTNGAEMRQ